MLAMPDGTKVRKDLMRQKFGRLTVIGYAGRQKGRGSCLWNCICECGNIITIRHECLMNGNTKSCGCLRRELCESKRLDITGRKVGRLTAVKYAGKDKRGINLWEFICDCGNIIIRRITDVQPNKTQSCGCLFREQATARIKTVRKPTQYFDGFAKVDHPLYHTWHGIRARCNDPNRLGYGSRGIKYDHRWDDFGIFLEDIKTLGSRPSLKHSLDRINVNCNYEIDNLRWADYGQQANNRRTVKEYLNYPGATDLINRANELGVDHRKLLEFLEANSHLFAELCK